MTPDTGPTTRCTPLASRVVIGPSAAARLSVAGRRHERAVELVLEKPAGKGSLPPLVWEPTPGVEANPLTSWSSSIFRLPRRRVSR